MTDEEDDEVLMFIIIATVVATAVMIVGVLIYYYCNHWETKVEKAWHTHSRAHLRLSVTAPHSQYEWGRENITNSNSNEGKCGIY